MSDNANTSHNKINTYPVGKTIKRLLKDILPIGWALLLATLVCGGSIALSVFAPEIIGQLSNIIYDFGDTGAIPDMVLVVQLCVKLALSYCGVVASSCLMVVLMTNITSRYFTCGMRIRISKKFNTLPISYVDNTPNGEIISRMMNDVSNMSNTIHVIIELFISGFIRLVVYTVMMYLINPIMATIVVVMVPLSLVLGTYISSKTEKYWRIFRETNGKMYAFVEEDYTGFDTIKAFNLEQRQQGLSTEIMADYGTKIQKAWYMSGLVQPIIALTNNIVYIAICIVGGYLVVNETIEVGAVVTITLYARMFAGPLESIAQGMSSINRTLACASRVYGLLDHEEMKEVDNSIVPTGKGDINIKDVFFSYVEDKPLIRNLNLSVKAGQKVAIVGPTGGGKTTIVNLLMRFYDIQSGSITIDGVDIMDMSRKDLRDQFAMVLQDTWLFNGTVYDNVAYGKDNATHEEVMIACKKAHIDFFIDTLPNGYDTIINEESSNISGGQKQLLTIARAYLADRKMLILDEATSNVDTRTELLIQQTMDELMQGRTSFVIAHRLSTIVNADIILVINDGQVVEQGTHSQLLANNGFYAEIYNSQYELLK